jgi:hypothetical protein
MKLHNDTKLFEQLVLLTAEDKGIEAGIVEKDYYVTAFLKSFVEKQPMIIFKGGTSLSKCYKVIQRFSEDIDLNLYNDNKPTESQRRRLKADIIDTINELGFTLMNGEKIRSRRDYNKYIIDFKSIFEFENLKQFLIVETAVFIPSYPIRPMAATSLIYDYLLEKGREDIIAKYTLESFEINVQDINRTFIDKVFAICDYYLAGKITEHSRHIYDIYKLYDEIILNDSLKKLFAAVKVERSPHEICLSAKEGVDVRSTLQMIIDRDVYKNDYETVTSGLLFENVTYSQAIKVLSIIAGSSLFD